MNVLHTKSHQLILSHANLEFAVKEKNYWAQESVRCAQIIQVFPLIRKIVSKLNAHMDNSFREMAYANNVRIILLLMKIKSAVTNHYVTTMKDWERTEYVFVVAPTWYNHLLMWINVRYHIVDYIIELI
jgi:hypothetical protein